MRPCGCVHNNTNSSKRISPINRVTEFTYNVHMLAASKAARATHCSDQRVTANFSKLANDFGTYKSSCAGQ